jgi:hypothetical protein
MKIPVALCWLLLLIATAVTAEPIASGAVQVIDGDTISARSVVKSWALWNSFCGFVGMEWCSLFSENVASQMRDAQPA